LATTPNPNGIKGKAVVVETHFSSGQAGYRVVENGKIIAPTKGYFLQRTEADKFLASYNIMQQNVSIKTRIEQKIADVKEIVKAAKGLLNYV
jgi:hypothetical protein